MRENRKGDSLRVAYNMTLGELENLQQQYDNKDMEAFKQYIKEPKYTKSQAELEIQPLRQVTSRNSQDIADLKHQVEQNSDELRDIKYITSKNAETIGEILELLKSKVDKP